MQTPPPVIARMAGWLRLTFAALALLGALTTAPVAAQTTSAAPSGPSGMAPIPAPSAAMTIQEYQGLSCLALGLITTFGVFIYSDVITEALTGAVVNPVLLIPVMALGFASGCSVGSTMSPGLLWISQRFR